MQASMVAAVAAELGMDPDKAVLDGLSGGAIARAYGLRDDRRAAFIKCLDSSQRPMLEAERHGLACLASAAAIRVPRVLGSGELDGTAWLALEWLDLKKPDGEAFARLGVQLARLHENQAARYGLDRDNFIGSTPQPNTPSDDWSTFFLETRLGFQLARLSETHTGIDAGQQLERLRQAWLGQFDGYQPQASLLHGDLWSGNVAILDRGDNCGDSRGGNRSGNRGEMVIFDPAVHYGDRECDLAMADLFGGFDAGFFSAYQGHWPLQRGWRERRRFYQLYHLLNHANLFGGHYVGICHKLIGQLGE